MFVEQLNNVVPSVGDRNRESWRLLVKECIAKIGKLRPLFLLKVWTIFWVWRRKKWVVGSVGVNQPTENSGGVSRGRVCGCDCWRWWHVTGDRWHVTHDFFSFVFFLIIFLNFFRFGATIRTQHHYYTLKFEHCLEKLWIIKVGVPILFVQLYKIYFYYSTLFVWKYGNMSNVLCLQFMHFWLE